MGKRDNRAKLHTATHLVAFAIGLMIAADTLAGPPPQMESRALVNLRGTVSERREWGPPGWGETPARDTHVLIYVLRLSTPATRQQLLADAAPPVTDEIYTEVQLVCDDRSAAGCSRAVRAMRGREVVVLGHADTAVYPKNRLPIVVTVQSVSDPKNP